MKRVVVAVILNPEGLMLMGRRKDDGKWTTPAGHCEPGEGCHAAVCREVKEEAGLTVSECQLVRAGMSDGGIMVHVFICKAWGRLDSAMDPDEEVSEWSWEDPFDHCNELHVPADQNFALQWYAQHYDLLRK